MNKKEKQLEEHIKFLQAEIKKKDKEILTLSKKLLPDKPEPTISID